MRRRRDGMFRLQMRRALESRTLPYAFLALAALVVVCFVQSCLMFWGHDAGEVPSAATLWVGYGWSSNARLMGFLTTYLLFPLTSALFADTLYEDRRRAAAYLLATRSTERRYVASGALAAFALAFGATLAVFLLSQALAFLAFPVSADPDAYFVFYDVSAETADAFAPYEGVPFSALLFSNRYLYNLLYCVYDALFAGAMALAAYAGSLYLRAGRLVVLGLPTMVLLSVSAVLPRGYEVASYLLPERFSAAASEAAVLLAPIVVAAVSCALIALPLALRRDVLR